MFARSVMGTKFGLLVAAGAVLGLLACASSHLSKEPVLEGLDVLSALEVMSGDDATSVMFVGVKETEVRVEQHRQPWAISVDLADVTTASDLFPVAVYDGTVDQVSAASFTDEQGVTRTRVEIALALEADYEVVQGDGGVTLRILASEDDLVVGNSGPKDLDTDVARLQNLEPVDPFVADSFLLEPVFASPNLAEKTVAGPPPAASVLAKLGVETVAGGVLFHLMADGIIEEMESFLIEDPIRLVIDLPGLVSQVVRSRTAVASPDVSAVRVGAHADKVRIVIDAGPSGQGFAGKRFMPVADGLFVAVGGGDAVDQAFAAGVAASEAAWLARAGESLEPTEPQLAAAIALELSGVLLPRPHKVPFAVVEPAFASTAPAEAADEVAPAVAFEAAAQTPSAASEPQSLASIDPVGTASEFKAVAVVPPAVPEPKRQLTVFGVEYHTDFDRRVERIAVLADGPAEFDWVALDAETVLIRLPNAGMDPAARGNIAPREGGPLSLIRAFEQPEVDPAEVRVVVKRAPNLVPKIEAVGHNLFIEFGIPESPQPASAEPAPDALAAVDPTAPRMPMEAMAAPAGAPVLSEIPAAPPAAPASPPASAAPAALEVPAAIDVLQEGGLIDGKEYRGRRISLDFKDVEIEDVLRLIAEVSDLNIISGDEVEGKVSIRLVDVPWDQALDVILLTKGLGFVRVGNVLRIAPSDVIAQEEEVRLQERRAKEKLEDLVVKLIAVNYGDVKSMQTLVKRFLTARGSVNVDERTSTLIVKDIASVIDEATALIAAVDTETPQVMIEAKVVEASLDFSRELGSAWAIGQTGNSDLGGEDFRFSAPPGSDSSIFDSNNVSVMNQIASSPTAAFNLSALLLDEKFNLDVQIQAAESTGNGKVVSSPRVVTMDNREATVEQGVSIPFQTFENGDAQLEFVDATLSLTVTPHITSDKSIIMAIEVTHDAPDTKVPTSTGSPAISKNQAKTETLVKDGQTLVLGGIYTVEKTMTQSRVPYLHRIPLIGAAFQNKSVTDKRKELLIFVTPRIVVQPNGSS